MKKIKKIADVGKTDLQKKKAIPMQGRFADAHERYLKLRGLSNHGTKRH